MYTVNTWLYRQKNLSQAPFSNRYTYPLASMQLGHTYKPEQIRKKKGKHKGLLRLTFSRIDLMIISFFSLSLPPFLGRGFDNSRLNRFNDSDGHHLISPCLETSVSHFFFSSVLYDSHFLHVCVNPSPNGGLCPLLAEQQTLPESHSSPPLCYSWLLCCFIKRALSNGLVHMGVRSDQGGESFEL